MRKATAISAGLHVAVLVWATLSLSGKALEATPPDALPVDMISEKDFSQMTKGAKDAPKPVEKPKPLVEKKAEPKPEIEDIKPKLTEKQEVKAASQKPPEPPKPPEPKKPEKQEAKADDKKPDPKPEEKKPDEIAKEIKKEDDKKLKEAKAEPKPMPPKKPVKKPPEFNPDKIAALLDQRAPQRQAIAGATIASPTLGTAMGNASQLSQSELDALRARLMGLWNPPVGIQNPEEYVIRIRLSIGRDRKLNAPPLVVSSGHGQLFNTARDSAVRAVLRGQPFDMLKADHYDVWKDIEVTFDPREMFGG